MPALRPSFPKLHPRPRRGFSLIECLATVAIIAVLAVVLSGAIGKVRQVQDRTVCGSNLRQIGLAAQNYALDNRGHYPVTFDLVLGVNNAASPGLIDRLAPYVGSESQWKIFYCPDAERCVPPPALATELDFAQQKIDPKPFGVTGYYWLVSTSRQWRPVENRDDLPPITQAGSSQRVLATCRHFGGGVVHNRAYNVLFTDGRVDTRKADSNGGLINYINQEATADQEALTFDKTFPQYQ